MQDNKKEMRMLGNQELWHFLTDFENFVLKNHQYNTYTQDFY